MRLTLAEPSYLKDSISVISDLVNEARFKITPQAIEMVAMDPANVTMVIFKLFSSSFTEYDVKEDIELGLNLNNLKQVLRRAKGSDTLTLEISQENKLQVTLKSKHTRTFAIPIIEFDEKEQKVPELNFDVSINAPSSVLNDAVDDVDIVAESVSFIADKDRFTIQAEGDVSKAEIEINAGDETKIEAPGEKTKARYSIEYLKKMINGSKLANNVEVFFSKDYPLRLDYKVIDRVLLSFILAPRVEND